MLPVHGPAPKGRTLPLSIALERLADETRRAVGLGHTLQGELGHVAAAGATSRALVVLQSLDLLCQTLAELALCLDSCALNAPASARLDPERLVEGLSLSDLAARLAERPPPAIAVTSGEVDLF